MEEKLSDDNLEEITDTLLENLDLKTGNIVSASTECGKVIDNFKYYIAVITDTELGNKAKVGDSVILKLFKKSRVYNKIDKSLATFILSFSKITLYIALLMSVASILGVTLTSFITLIGSAGVAIGLSLQGGLSNIAGGIIILLFKPFQVGDYVDTHVDSGTVRAISLFYTTLVTPDNKVISIPNGNLANEATVNYSKEKTRKLEINFDISYKNNMDKVKEVITSLYKDDKRIINENGKEPFLRITNYKDSSVTYTLRLWVKNSEFWDIKFDILERSKVSFEKENIEIPYPQLDVHIDNNK